MTRLTRLVGRAGLLTVGAVWVAQAAAGQVVVFEDRTSAIAIDGRIEGAPPPYDKIGGEAYYDGMGMFDELISDTSEYYELSIRGEVSQTSYFDEHAVTASGEAYARAFDDYGYAGAWASGANSFGLAFSPRHAMRVELTSELAFNQGSDPAVLAGFVSLSRVGGPVLVNHVSAGSYVDALVLPPESYLLRCDANAYADLGAGGGDAYISGRASYAVGLAFRLHGDLNADGAVDLLDFDLLLAGYAAPGPVAYDDGDLDGDGDVDLRDAAEFQRVFGVAYGV